MSVDVVTIGIVCADVVVRPVDSFPERGRLLLVPHLEIHLGGLAGVTATVLCQLGARAAFVGCVGQDGFGDFVLGAMASQGVDVSRVRRTTDRGSSSTVVLVSEDGERSFMHHVGANGLVCENDADFEFIAGARVLHWGGPGVTPGLDGEPIGRIFAEAKARGMITSMDTCFDASGGWYDHIEYAMPHLDIVMSSFEEACHFTGQNTPETIADFYRAKGAETVMIKLGGDGLYLKDSKESHRIAAHRVPVVDTTGAGDAACAGFLYGYVHGWSLLRSGQLANAVGGLTVQRMGGAEAVESLEKTLAFMEGKG